MTTLLEWAASAFARWFRSARLTPAHGWLLPLAVKARRQPPVATPRLAPEDR
jgi:hypothetical protein